MNRSTVTQPEAVAKSPRWQYHSSNYSARRHCVVYRDKALGVEMHVTTKRNWIMFPGKEKIHYCIDGDPREYVSEVELTAELGKRWRHDDSERYSLIVHWGRQA